MGRLGVTGEAIFSYLIPRPALPHNNSPANFHFYASCFLSNFLSHPSFSYFFLSTFHLPPPTLLSLFFFLSCFPIDLLILFAIASCQPIPCLLAAPSNPIMEYYSPIPCTAEGGRRPRPKWQIFYILCISTSESLTLTKMRCWCFLAAGIIFREYYNPVH